MHGVVTSVGLVSSSFDIIQVSIMRISDFPTPVGYGYFMFTYHARTCIPRLNPNNNSGIQKFSHLYIPTKFQYLTDITILIPAGRFFWYYYWCCFFDTIINFGYLIPMHSLCTGPTFVATQFKATIPDIIVRNSVSCLLNLLYAKW